MQFLIPGFLLAALAIAIPVLIHLFWFRRFKPVYFTNVRFLREIKEEKASRSRLRNLLVLLSRILAVLALVFAFAQPFLPKGDPAASGPKAVSIYVDNSFSMQSKSQDVSLLELAKMKARQLVEGYGYQDRFQILTNAHSGVGQRMVSKEEALSAIDAITIQPVSNDFEALIRRQQQHMNASGNLKPVVYWLSDFQKTGGAPTTFSSDTAISYFAIPVSPVQELNISIDTVWMEGPVPIRQQPVTLICQITNHSTTPVEQVRLAIREGNQEKPVSTIQLDALSTITDTIIFSPQQIGWQEIQLSVQDYPIQYDDRYYLAIQVLEKVNILVIHDQQAKLNVYKGLQGLAAVNLDTRAWQNLDFATLPLHQLIILDGLPELSSGLKEALYGFMTNGGNVLMFPPSGRSDLPGYAAFLDGIGARKLQAWQPAVREIGTINTASVIFNDVYLNANAHLALPQTIGNYTTSIGSKAEEPLLTYRDGQICLSAYRYNKGRFFFCSSPLDDTPGTLARSGEVFVPMVYKMAVIANSTGRAAYTIGHDREVLVKSNITAIGDDPIRLKASQYEFVPGVRMAGGELSLAIPEEIPADGVYDIMVPGGQPIGKIALNFDRRESGQQFYTADELKSFGLTVPDDVARADLGNWVGEKERGLLLWRWCVILALLFLLTETLLLRLWKA